MNIIFNPPIGDSIQLETSLSSKTVLLHFTAELTAHDQNKLIQDRARIQLWSDLPHDDHLLYDGAWGALDLTNQAQDTEEMSSTLYKVTLGSSHPIQASEEKVTLSLEVVAPLHTSRPFSFTYRIIYPSGDIQWLGAFGQNGLLTFERSDYYLRNFGLHSWTFDESRMAHIYDVKQSVGTLVVSRVKDICNYHVRAIGPTSFVSDLKDAALLFFVPRSQSSAISLLPTYVFSASPGSSLTLSAEGHIIASGSGTLLFQANDDHLEPMTSIRQLLSHAQLDRWNVLAWDANSKAIVLTTPKDKLPIKAVTIPLWHSKILIRPIHLEISALYDLFGSTEFSIFSPNNMRIHLFFVDPQATPKKQMLSLQSDTNGNDLVMSPIYTLRGYQPPTYKPATIWKSVILSPYQVQNSPSDDSSILPTPPLSPYLQPISHLSQARSPCDSAMSSVPSLPSDTCISLQSPMNDNSESENHPSSSPDPDAYNPLQIQRWFRFPQSIIAMFRPFFYSFFFIYGLFLGPRLFGPLRRGNITDDWPQSQISTGTEDDVGALDEDVPDDSRDESENIPETEILLEGDTEIRTIRAQPSQSDAEIPEAVTKHADVSRASDDTKGDAYYRVQSEPSSDSSSKKMKTITIALLYTTNHDSESLTAPEDTANSDASSVINKNKNMERCVQFVDGSEPECVVTRSDADVFYYGRVPGKRQVGNSYSCCLLQYQLDWVEKSERTIRISPHSVDLFD